MIEDQQNDPIYGVFASQIGFAESFPMVDYFSYKDVFALVVDSATSSGTSQSGLVYAQELINDLLPEEGLLPAIEPKDDEEEEDEG